MEQGDPGGILQRQQQPRLSWLPPLNSLQLDIPRKDETVSSATVSAEEMG